ncbi:MAG: hypothetical protein AAF624_00595 [Bacteroidota bacterium]
MPEPNPAKHADDDAEGRSPAGHAPDGSDTHSAPPGAEAAAATWRTQATDRAAS